MLVHVPMSDTVFGDSVISVDHVQDIASWGIKIRTKPVDNPGTSSFSNNGFLEATLTFGNPGLPWLTALADQETSGSANWIRSGTYSSPGFPEHDDYLGYDDNEVYESVLNGTWSPYRLAAHSSPTGAGGSIVNPGSPAWDKYRVLTLMKNVASVDVVITSDMSKWTRCPVIELQESSGLALGGAKKMDMRKSLSVDKNGKKLGDPGYNASQGGFVDSAGTLVSTPNGMGWFPGYAVNLETGERLNMAFGEDSWYAAENGTDMKWNPTSTVTSGGNPIYGGKHYIYVFGHNGDAKYSSFDPVLANQLRDIPVYDGGLALYKLYRGIEMASSSMIADGYKREIYSDAMWVNIPLLNPGHTLLATNVNVRLRVSKQYRQQYTDGTNNSNPKYIFDSGTISGISKLTEDVDFILYPNPATNVLNITFKAGLGSSVITIYDLSGRKLMNVKGNNLSKQTIDVSSLSSGLYILKLTDARGTIFTERFVKP